MSREKVKEFGSREGKEEEEGQRKGKEKLKRREKEAGKGEGTRKVTRPAPRSKPAVHRDKSSNERQSKREMGQEGHELNGKGWRPAEQRGGGG